jgi:hypothetical protein
VSSTVIGARSSAMRSSYAPSPVRCTLCEEPRDARVGDRLLVGVPAAVAPKRIVELWIA